MFSSFLFSSWLVWFRGITSIDLFKKPDLGVIDTLSCFSVFSFISFWFDTETSILSQYLCANFCRCALRPTAIVHYGDVCGDRESLKYLPTDDHVAGLTLLMPFAFCCSCHSRKVQRQESDAPNDECASHRLVTEEMAALKPSFQASIFILFLFNKPVLTDEKESAVAQISYVRHILAINLIITRIFKWLQVFPALGTAG